MKIKTGKGKWFIAGAFLALSVWIMTTAMAQNTGPASTSPKNAGETFKNIQILKDMPADQLGPTMEFMSASLGVGCDFCHVPGSFEKDDKDNKGFAREMMKMMFAVNKSNFGDHREVTCYTCHHGQAKPVAVPLLADVDGKPAKPPRTPKVTAQEVLDKYTQAVGGADALQKISSRIQKGKAAAFGKEFPLEVYTQAPGKFAFYMHMPAGDSATVFNGQQGWVTVPGRPMHDLSGGELDSVKMDANLQFPLTAKQLFKEIKVTGTEKIGDHDTILLTGERADMPPVKYYFDQQSGLLVRELRFAETALGHLPLQIDYSDYRDSNGVKVPFQWSVLRPGMKFAMQIDQVQQNVPIDEAKFAKPPAPPPTQR
jgi:hypothetical protein